jgi:hypothetical protein
MPSKILIPNLSNHSCTSCNRVSYTSLTFGCLSTGYSYASLNVNTSIFGINWQTLAIYFPFLPSSPLNLYTYNSSFISGNFLSPSTSSYISYIISYMLILPCFSNLSSDLLSSSSSVDSLSSFLAILFLLGSFAILLSCYLAKLPSPRIAFAPLPALVW